MRKLSIHTSRITDVVALCYLIFEQTALPTLVLWLNTLLPSPFDAVELNVMIFALNFIVTTVLFGNYLLRHIRDFIRRPMQLLFAALCGLSVYLVANFAVNLMIAILYPGFFNANNAVIAAGFQKHYFLMALSTIILAPVAEELLYRGLVFRLLYRKNPYLGYIVSVLIFCGIHVVGYIGAVDGLMLAVSFIQYIPAAVVLAACYAQTDSIFVPIIIHMTINLMAVANMR